jgi:diacylglycerol kinase family enzyme
MSDPARERLPVILNAHAGRGNDAAVVRKLEEAFAASGVRIEVLRVESGASIEQLMARVLSWNPPVVVAAGGDGTVSAVARCLKGTGVALGVLPMGTLNHFAGDIGMPLDLDAAVKAIAAGKRVGVDVGEVNDRTFINNASLGIYPAMVRGRSRQQRLLGRDKFWATLWATLAVLRRSPFLRLHLEVDGQPVHCKSPFVFVGNNDYVMEGFHIGTRSSLRDNRLSIYTTQRRTRWGLLRLGFRALFGRLKQADDFATQTASQLRIDSRHRRLLVATDGEVTAMQTPLNFRVMPRALQVLVPPG